ncbi:putative sodium/metabolite cotransporter BASS4 [Chlorella vulgaris]
MSEQPSESGGGNGGAAKGRCTSFKAVDWKKVWARISKFIVTNFLPLSFLVAIIWALAWPAPGKACIEVTIGGDIHVIQGINIILVFFISGLVLKTDDLAAAMKHKLGLAFGLISILFVTPCLGFALRVIPLNPPEFAAGLALFAAVPTTLGVGVSLVRSCGGNEGLALLLTVASNIIGIFSMPLWLKALLGSSSDLDSVSVDIPDLLARLSITILVPSVVGKLLRELPPFSRHVKRFTNKYKTAISMFSVVMLAMIVWQSLSGAQATLLDQQFVQILYVILLAIGQHLVYLFINFAALHFLFKLPLVDLISAGIMSSQKSAPVAVTVTSYLTSSVSKQGLIIIPAIVGQISQIFIGSALAKWLAPRVKRQKAADAAARLAAAELDGSDDAKPGLQGGIDLSTLGSRSMKSLTDTEADVEAGAAADAGPGPKGAPPILAPGTAAQ